MYMKFQPYRNTSLEGWMYRVGAVLGSTIVAHQFIYFATPMSYHHKMVRTIKSTFRPMEHTFTVFSIKIFTDFLEEKMKTKWSEYSKGAVSGLFCYVISRPLDQLELARH